VRTLTVLAVVMIGVVLILVRNRFIVLGILMAANIAFPWDS
jgi:hypothetical protein